MEERFHEVAGARLRALHAGTEGPLVVLLHGTTDGADSYVPVLRELAGEARAVAVDLPGHGGSQHTGRYRFAEQAEVIAALLRELGGADVLGGHSGGGVVATVVALAHPELVGGLLLEDPPWPLILDRERAADSPFKRGFDAIAELARREPRPDGEAWTHAVGELPVMVPGSTLRLRDALPERGLRQVAHVLSGYDPRYVDQTFADDYFAPAELAGLRCPARLLAGVPERGGALTPADLDVWRPYVDVHVREDAGHLFHHLPHLRDWYLDHVRALLP